MAASDRKRLLAALVVLVAAVLIAAVMIVRAPDDSSGVEAQTTTRAATAPADSPSQVAVDEVRLELLRPAVNTSPEVGRNPFRFEARAEQGAGPVVAAPAPATQPSRPGPSPVPPIALRFIGILEGPASTGRVAILSDGRGNVFNGKVGDVIEGRYRVVSVGVDAAELSYLDGRGRQTIRMSGQ